MVRDAGQTSAQAEELQYNKIQNLIPRNAQSKAMTIKPTHLNLYDISHKKMGHFSALQRLPTTTLDKIKITLLKHMDTYMQHKTD
jgi:hypothetical protein